MMKKVMISNSKTTGKSQTAAKGTMLLIGMLIGAAVCLFCINVLPNLQDKYEDYVSSFVARAEGMAEKEVEKGSEIGAEKELKEEAEEGAGKEKEEGTEENAEKGTKKATEIGGEKEKKERTKETPEIGADINDSVTKKDDAGDKPISSSGEVVQETKSVKKETILSDCAGKAKKEIEEKKNEEKREDQKVTDQKAADQNVIASLPVSETLVVSGCTGYCPTSDKAPGQYDYRPGDYFGELSQFIGKPVSEAEAVLPSFTKEWYGTTGRLYDNTWMTVEILYKDVVYQINITQSDPRYTLMGVSFGMPGETARSILADQGYYFDAFYPGTSHWTRSADGRYEVEVLTYLDNSVLTMTVRCLN